MPLRRSYLALLCPLIISACQSTPTAPHPDKNPLLPALLHLESQQYLAAEEGLRKALNTGNELTKQQALAGLSLLHLQHKNIDAATSRLDELYQAALRNPQADNSLKMLRISLILNLENTLHLQQARQEQQAAAAKQEQLTNEILALQRALAKLRQLSLH